MFLLLFFHLPGLFLWPSWNSTGYTFLYSLTEINIPFLPLLFLPVFPAFVTAYGHGWSLLLFRFPDCPYRLSACSSLHMFLMLLSHFHWQSGRYRHPVLRSSLPRIHNQYCFRLHIPHFFPDKYPFPVDVVHLWIYWKAYRLLRLYKISFSSHRQDSTSGSAPFRISVKIHHIHCHIRVRNYLLLISLDLDPATVSDILSRFPLFLQTHWIPLRSGNPVSD